MVEFSKDQRTLAAETLCDLANVAAGAIVFGQFACGQPASLRMVLFGTAGWFGLVGAGLWFRRMAK